jgi:hypothetical protein
LVPSANDNQVNWGVEGKFKSNKDANRKNIINKDTKILQDDKKVLDDVVSRLDTSINSLTDLTQFLQSYSKINPEGIETIITKIKSFKEVIKGELNNLN